MDCKNRTGKKTLLPRRSSSDLCKLGLSEEEIKTEIENGEKCITTSYGHERKCWCRPPTGTAGVARSTRPLNSLLARDWFWSWVMSNSGNQSCFTQSNNSLPCSCHFVLLDTLELVRDLVKMPRKTRTQAVRSLPVSCEEKRDIRYTAWQEQEDHVQINSSRSNMM